MPISNEFIRLSPLVLLTLTACGGGGGGNGGAGLDPPGPSNPPPVSTVQTQQVFANVAITQPTALTQAPGDPTRWFAIGRGGLVTVFNNDTANATGSTFLNVTGRVDSSFNESGLLGIAFHPEFATNGEVFISYTAPGPLTSVVSRFRSLDGNQTLDPASEEILLYVTQEFSNHNGGDIHFGPDGILYIGFGDGGSGGDPNSRGQDTNNLLGTIVRIDVDIAAGYNTPPTNAFPAGALCGAGGFGGGDCSEIFAWGFRNPWRFSFDQMTGELWVGDVGQGAWEEIDRVSVGENYGWNTREGAHCFNPSSGCNTNGLIDPITEYGRSEGQSITGGYVYRGTAIAGLVGHYIFGDFASGRIWSVPADSPIGTAPNEIADTTYLISAFAEGIDGELYVVDYGGTVHQIIP
jgi:glucose/arabinose dehydrogenase